MVQARAARGCDGADRGRAPGIEGRRCGRTGDAGARGGERRPPRL